MTSFMLLQYDPLVENERNVHRPLDALQRDGGNGAGPAFAHDLAAYHRVLDEKLAIQERVKSQVAMVRNGLLYLPLAVAGLSRSDPALGGGMRPMS